MRYLGKFTEMTKTTSDTPTDQRPTLPRWSFKDQDLWTDFFQDFAGHLLERERVGFTDADRIRAAALLADVAMQELQYRFWIQHKARTAKRGKPRTKAGKR